MHKRVHMQCIFVLMCVCSHILCILRVTVSRSIHVHVDVHVTCRYMWCIVPSPLFHAQGARLGI